MDIDLLQGQHSLLPGAANNPFEVLYPQCSEDTSIAAFTFSTVRTTWPGLFPLQLRTLELSVVLVLQRISLFLICSFHRPLSDPEPSYELSRSLSWQRNLFRRFLASPAPPLPWELPEPGTARPPGTGGLGSLVCIMKGFYPIILPHNALLSLLPGTSLSS